MHARRRSDLPHEFGAVASGFIGTAIRACQICEIFAPRYSLTTPSGSDAWYNLAKLFDSPATQGGVAPCERLAMTHPNRIRRSPYFRVLQERMNFFTSVSLLWLFPLRLFRFELSSLQLPRPQTLIPRRPTASHSTYVQTTIHSASLSAFSL